MLRSHRPARGAICSARDHASLPLAHVPGLRRHRPHRRRPAAPGFQIQWDKWWGFVICILIFAILQSVLAPWVSKLADRYAPVLMGGIGIFSTLIALHRRRAAAHRRAAHRRRDRAGCSAR